MYISRRTFLKCAGAATAAVTISGCSAEQILNGNSSSGDEAVKGSTADMKTLLQSFIEVSVQDEIRDACFLDPNTLQVGNHVITFPCTLQSFIDTTGFETDANMQQLLSSGESVDVLGVLDGSEYTLTCSAKTTDNSATALVDALVDKDTIESARYGQKAFIYPGGVRPSFTKAKDLQDVFGQPSYVKTDKDEDENSDDQYKLDFGDSDSESTVDNSNLVYQYFLTVLGRGEGEVYENADATQELGVKYYINRQSGMVTKVRYTDGLSYIVQGDLAINGFGTLETIGLTVPMLNNIETTDDVDGQIVIWKPYPNAGKYYSVDVFTNSTLLYGLNGTDSVASDGWYEKFRAQLQGIVNSGADSTASSAGSQIDVTSETTTDSAQAAQYMEDLATMPEEVSLLRLDGYTIVTNDVGYVGYKKVADDKNHLVFAYYGNTDVHQNNHQNCGMVYLELRRAQRTYGASDSNKLNDSNVAQAFSKLAEQYAIQMLKDNS